MMKMKEKRWWLNCNGDWWLHGDDNCTDNVKYVAEKFMGK